MNTYVPLPSGVRRARRRWWPVVAFGLLAIGCWVPAGQTGAPPAGEKKVLEALTRYGARHELDRDGHVGRLILEGDNVTDDALVEVHALPYLKRLSLDNSYVSDRGLGSLVKCKRLERLDLLNTKVTDAGVAHLHRMPSLRTIWVSKSRTLTDRGVSGLRRALPATKVLVGAM